MTLMFRQSSLLFPGLWNKGRLSMILSTDEGKIRGKTLEFCEYCGQDGAVPEASKTPRDAVPLTGGLSRRGPTGGSAKGMPLKDWVPMPLAPTRWCPSR